MLSIFSASMKNEIYGRDVVMFLAAMNAIFLADIIIIIIGSSELEIL